MDKAADSIASGQFYRFLVLSDGGSYEGETWPPLAPLTLKLRHAAGVEEDDILVVTGNLRTTLKFGDVDHYRVYRADGVDDGTQYWLAPIHHFGTATIPARTVQGPLDAQAMIDLEFSLVTSMTEQTGVLLGNP